MKVQMGVDERVDQVLRTFAGAEADAGLEGRVLTRLATMRVEPADATSMWSARSAVACACIALCVCVIWVRQEGSVRSVKPLRTAILASTGAARASARSVPGLKGELANGGSAAATRESGTRVIAHVTPRQRSTDRLRVDAVAESEMAAPTLVAPPEPVTEQERLLLRVAKHSGASALAEEEPSPDVALPVEQTKRQAEPRTLFAAFGKGLFAGINVASDE